MIVVRDGVPINVGTGIYTLAGPFDQIIKYPTHLRGIQFEATQVTNEFQGVSVVGQMIWKPIDDKDGPYKLYTAFGDCLQK